VARDDHAAEELRRQSAERRVAIGRTAAALEHRLREKKRQIGNAFDRTREKLSRADQLVRRHPHVFAGGAVGLGLYLGLRGERTRYRYTLVERPHRSMVGSALSAVADLALRHGASWLLQRLGDATEEAATSEREAPLLPPARPSSG
jgi:ElaB/YqjD/DUF883 family membrane-anchored ribosome-binding protein